VTATHLPVADGHADSLMWNRDLTVRQRGGHLDFVRLREAGVRLQAFTVVTQGYPFVDGMGLFARARGWPAEARRGPWARCLWQVERLHALCAASGGAARVAGTRAALDEALGAGALAAVLGIEGGQALEGRPERVGALRARGVSFMSLTHLANNALGGASSPLQGNRPLTALGREVLLELSAAGMAVDVAHASPRTLADVLAEGRPRPFCSHTGVAGAKASWRNLDDAALRAIAERGGVVGIIFGTIYLGGSDVGAVVRHLEHALDVAGEDAVGFGSDFDGMVPLPQGLRDVTGLPGLVDALAARRPERVVEKVAFGNWRRFFGEVLGATP
jgi:membrane dipeptidase